MKFALAAFIVPFAFVYQPGLMLQGGVIGYSAADPHHPSPASSRWQLALEGYLRGPIAGWARLLIFAAGICLITDHWQAIAAGAAILVVLWALPQSGVRGGRTSDIRPR